MCTEWQEENSKVDRCVPDTFKASDVYSCQKAFWGDD